VKCAVDGFFTDTSFGTPVEKQQLPAPPAVEAITRIESPNRIYVSAANFLAVSGPSEGDLVAWTAPAASPYSNGGTYRVSKILDANRLELVTEDYKPVYLNPSVGVGLGTIEVTTDGDFYPTPVARFAAPILANFNLGIGAIPGASEDFSLVYMQAKSVRQAYKDDPAAFTNTLSGETEATAATQQAIMRIVGPSVTSFDEVLFAEELLSLEFLSREHYNNSGRHSTIHPDVLDMFPGVAGTTAFFRGNDLEADSVSKVAFLEHLGGSTYDEAIVFKNDGRLFINQVGAVAPQHFVGGGRGLYFGTNTTPHVFLAEMNTNSAGNFPSYLKFSVEEDGIGGSVDNMLVLNRDGRIGFGMGLSKADTGFFAEPQATAHIRARFSEPAINVVIDEVVPVLLAESTRGRFKSSSGDSFTSAMIGRDFVSSGTVSNNGTFRVIDVISTTELEVYTQFPQATVNEGPGIGGTGFMEAGDRELLRLEGFDASDNTVAMTYKPKLDQPIYAFSEMDHTNPGGAGDWTWNSVLTATAGADSDGAHGDAYWRWVHGAGGGSEIEVMRLRKDHLLFDSGSSMDFTFADGGVLEFSGVAGSRIGFLIANSEIEFEGANGVVKFGSSGLVEFTSTGKISWDSDSKSIEDVGAALLVKAQSVYVGSFGALGFGTGAPITLPPRAQLDVRGDTTGYDAALLFAQADAVPTSANGTRKTIKWLLTQGQAPSNAALRINPIWEAGTAVLGAANPGLSFTRNALIQPADDWRSDDNAKTSSGFFIESSQSNGVEDKFSFRFAAATAGALAWVERVVVRGTSPHLDVFGDVGAQELLLDGAAIRFQNDNTLADVVEFATLAADNERAFISQFPIGFSGDSLLIIASGINASEGVGQIQLKGQDVELANFCEGQNGVFYFRNIAVTWAGPITPGYGIGTGTLVPPGSVNIQPADFVVGWAFTAGAPNWVSTNPLTVGAVFISAANTVSVIIHNHTAAGLSVTGNTDNFDFMVMKSAPYVP
jgi:hypothetical protein